MGKHDFPSVTEAVAQARGVPEVVGGFSGVLCGPEPPFWGQYYWHWYHGGGVCQSALPLAPGLLMRGEICNVEEIIHMGESCEGAGEKRGLPNSARKGLCLRLQKASLQEQRAEVRSSAASFTCR